MRTRIGAALLLGLVAAGLYGIPAAGAESAVVNGKIAFDTARDTAVDQEIYVMNANGSAPTRLTNNLAYDGMPDWSPAGNKIAFRSDRDGNDEIYVMNANGSGQSRLTNDPDFDSEPDWSPNGTKIAFTTDRDGSAVNTEVYVMNANGSAPVNLTNNPAQDFDPAWSPDGTKIAFASERDGDRDVFVMNANGSAPINLTSNNPTNDVAPAWSPDGTKIAFTTERDGATEVYVMNADGTNPVNLTKHPSFDEDPAWAPDGTKIAFLTYRDGSAEIYVMNTDGSAPVNLTNNPADDHYFSWQALRSKFPLGPGILLPNVRVPEGDGGKFSVSLRVALDQPARYRYKTRKGTAKPGKDFKPTSGTLRFAPGETTKKVRIKTIEDEVAEKKEILFLRIRHSGGTSQGKVKIKDDD